MAMDSTEIAFEFNLRSIFTMLLWLSHTFMPYSIGKFSAKLMYLYPALSNVIETV